VSRDEVDRARMFDDMKASMLNRASCSLLEVTVCKRLVLRCASVQVGFEISDGVCLWQIPNNKARFYVGPGNGVGTTFEGVGGAVCEIMRMPGTRCIGTNEPSQSAYAMPRLTLVDNETGHVRPAIKRSSVKQNTSAGVKVGKRLKRMTERTTPTPKPRPMYKNESANS